MAKELKKLIVGDYERRLGRVEGCVVIDFNGLDSEQTADLRSSLREACVRMSVVHNRLARRAFEAGGAVPQAFLDLFRGPTALLFGADGAVSASKGISRWHRKNQGAAPIKGGLLKGKVLAPGEVKQLAELPDAPTLRSQVAARMLSPAQVLATAASSLVARFAGSVRARRESLEAGEGGGTEESPG